MDVLLLVVVWNEVESLARYSVAVQSVTMPLSHPFISELQSPEG